MSKAEPQPAKKSMRRELLEGAILEAASKLFIERGYPGTRMNDIAELLGVTRTAIYYYFRNKEAILIKLTSAITEKAAQLADETLAQQQAPLDTLRLLVRQHAQLVLTHPLQFRVVERNEQYLPQEMRLAAEKSRRALLNRFVEVINQGMQHGIFRNVNPKITAFALLGMCNWGAWWFNPQGSLTVEQIIDLLVDLALHSVMPTDQEKVQGVSLTESVQQLREGLNLLEKRLDLEAKQK